MSTTPADAADIVEQTWEPKYLRGVHRLGKTCAEQAGQIAALRAHEAELTASLMATAEAAATHLKRATELQRKLDAVCSAWWPSQSCRILGRLR